MNANLCIDFSLLANVQRQIDAIIEDPSCGFPAMIVAQCWDLLIQVAGKQRG
ncbi:MAG: hypothetical protein OXF56_20540 [Rhodobacteraceae bacterium]|nr:hypothetical protein [Paracoccaceae bacterium]